MHAPCDGHVQRRIAPWLVFTYTKRMKNKGFTVLELLVSVAIIAMLSAITMAFISAAREKSRDAKRMSALHQLQNALNIYVTQVGRFPIALGATALSGTDAVSETLVNQDAMKAASVDPLYPQYVYVYQSNSDGTVFTISFCLETDTIKGYYKGCDPRNIITP